ncbi:MAG: AraC family transcriptional regulator [Blastocatellia bacterium]
MIIRLPGGQFGGSSVESCQLEGVRLTETRYQSGLSIPRHAHELACFVLVVKGSFRETIERRARDCGPLTLIYRPAGEVHSNHFHRSGGQCLNIELEPEWMERVRRYSIRLNDSAEFRGGAPAWLAVRLYREFRQPDEVSPLTIEACMLEIVAASAREQRKAVERKVPRWLVRAEEFLRAHYSESLTVAEVADAAAVHPAHLARVFRASFGCTIGEYLRQLRVEFASRELIASDLPLSEIAAATGFYDQSHFTRTFKRMTGLTPTEFRASTHPC